MVAVYFNCKQTSCIASKGILWRLKIKVMQFKEHSGVNIVLVDLYRHSILIGDIYLLEFPGCQNLTEECVTDFRMHAFKYCDSWEYAFRWGEGS